MSEWVLILSMAFGFGMDGKGAALHSIGGFPTQKACEEAREKAITLSRVEAVCIKKIG